MLLVLFVVLLLLVASYALSSRDVLFLFFVYPLNSVVRTVGVKCCLPLNVWVFCNILECDVLTKHLWFINGNLFLRSFNLKYILHILNNALEEICMFNELVTWFKINRKPFHKPRTHVVLILHYACYLLYYKNELVVDIFENLTKIYAINLLFYIMRDLYINLGICTMIMVFLHFPWSLYIRETWNFT